MRKLQKSGFTLLELLVVIAVIGILSSVLLFAVNDARAKSRDAERIRTLHEIKTAIELFYHEHGRYPLCNGKIFCTTKTTPIGYYLSSEYDAMNQMEMVPKYIPRIPNDPKQTNTQDWYGYYYAFGWKKAGVNSIIETRKNSDYVLGTYLERTTTPDSECCYWGATVNYLVGNQ